MSMLQILRSKLSSRIPSPSSPRATISRQSPVASFGEPVEVAPSMGQRNNVAPLKAMGKCRRIAIATLIIASNLVQMISNIIGLAGGLAIGKDLGVVAGPGRANWVAASYPLTQGTFVLVSGRLGAVYGHENVLLAGGAWFVLWSVVNGFCSNFVAFNAARALSGIGGAMIMPNAVAMIGIAFPPGKMRNISLGFFGASAPIGGYLGSILVGIMTQYASWKWTFFVLAILGTCVFGALWFLLLPEIPVDRRGKIDWVGAGLGSSGLIVFNVAWNQAPAVGWSTPYEIVLLIVAVMLLGIFIIWEARLAKTPILPLNIFRAPSFLPLIVVVLLSFMSFGTLLWYMVAWQQLIRRWSALQFAYGWTPFAMFGTIGAGLAAWLIPKLAAQWILAIGAAMVLISNLLLATMPRQQTYWLQVFPATVLMAFCPDFVFTAAQIIASNSVRKYQQGIAASLIGTLNLYGNSLGLGFAGTVETEVNKFSSDPVKGYRAALYFGVGLAAVAFLLDIGFVRMAKDEREGWADVSDDDSAPRAVSTGTELSSAPFSRQSVSGP